MYNSYVIVLFISSSAPPQHQPYMYPLDFSAPGTHPGYAMPVSPFNGAEIYGVSGMGGNSHDAAQQQPNHVEQFQDISGQYSQGIAEIQNPNITGVFGQPQQASKRWDGMYENENIFYNTKKYKKETGKFDKKSIKHAFKHEKTGQAKSHAFKNTMVSNVKFAKNEQSYLFERDSDDVDGLLWKPLFDGKPLEIDASLLDLDNTTFNHTPNQNTHHSYFTASDLENKLFGNDSNSEKRKKYKSKEGLVFEPLPEVRGEVFEIPTKSSTNFGIEDAVVSHIQRIDSNQNKQKYKTWLPSDSLVKLKLKTEDMKFNKLKTHFNGSVKTLGETLLLKETKPQVNQERPFAAFLTGENPDQWNINRNIGDDEGNLHGTVDIEPYAPSNDASNKNYLFKIPQGSKSNSFDITIGQNYRVQDNEDTPKPNNGFQKKMGPFEKRDTSKQTESARLYENQESKNHQEKIFYNITVTDNKSAYLFIPKESYTDSGTINGFYPISPKTQFANPPSNLFKENFENGQNNGTQSIKKSDRFLENKPKVLQKIEKLTSNPAVEQFKQGFVTDFSPKVFDITVSDEHSNFSVFIPRQNMFLHNHGPVKAQPKIRKKRSFPKNRLRGDFSNLTKSEKKHETANNFRKIGDSKPRIYNEKRSKMRRNRGKKDKLVFPIYEVYCTKNWEYHSSLSAILYFFANMFKYIIKYMVNSQQLINTLLDFFKYFGFH